MKIKPINGTGDPHPPPPAPYVQPGGKGGKDGGKATGKNGGKDGGKKQDGKGGSKGDFKQEFTADGKPICRYFLSSGGCRKGARCSFPHEWGSQSKQGRCWECGSVHHMKPDCPTLKKDTPKVMKTDSKKEVVFEATPAPTSTGELMGGANQASSGQPAALNPVGGLLKLLEIAGAIPVQEAVHVKAADPKSSLRALLDGGATHVLRPAHSTEEYEGAIPIKVELAAGETTLRQVQGSQGHEVGIQGDLGERSF